MLRSLHLPGESLNVPGPHLPCCRSCDNTEHRDDKGQVSEAELRWRHICDYICDCRAISVAMQARHDFRTAMSELPLQSDMQFDVRLSVLDVSLTVDLQSLIAFVFDPGSICTASPHTLPSCVRIVNNLLTAVGHAVCTAILLAVCPLFLPLLHVVDARMSMSAYREGQILRRGQETTASYEYGD
jgi:hypothetical protein